MDSYRRFLVEQLLIIQQVDPNLVDPEFVRVHASTIVEMCDLIIEGVGRRAEANQAWPLSA